MAPGRRQASRRRSSRPPSSRAPAAQAASTPRPCPGADGQVVQAGGGLDGQAGGHGPDLLDVPGQVRAAGHRADDREQVEQAEYHCDGGRRIAERGGGTDAEQGDQREVENRAEGGAEHWPVAEGQGRVAVARPDAVAGQDEPPGQQRGKDGEGPGDQHQSGQDGGLGRQHGDPPGHRGQGEADHARAVLAADGHDGQHRDHRLAEVDAGQADLGRVLGAAPRRATGGRGRRGTDRDGQRRGAEQQPAGAGQGAQLGPLGVQRIDHGDGGRRGQASHASLRRSRIAARARASSAYPQSTANPAHGASG